MLCRLRLICMVEEGGEENVENVTNLSLLQLYDGLNMH